MAWSKSPAESWPPGSAQVLGHGLKLGVPGSRQPPFPTLDNRERRFDAEPLHTALQRREGRVEGRTDLVRFHSSFCLGVTHAASIIRLCQMTYLA